MPLYHIGAPQSIYPRDIGTFMGLRAIPGGPADREVDTDELFPAGDSSRPVVIAALHGNHPTTQRTIIWRVFGLGSGSCDIQLQASIDDVDANYVTIDTATSDGQRHVQADGVTGAQGTPALVSSARFWRIHNAGSTVTLLADMNCM